MLLKGTVKGPNKPTRELTLFLYLMDGGPGVICKSSDKAMFVTKTMNYKNMS